MKVVDRIELKLFSIIIIIIIKHALFVIPTQQLTIIVKTFTVFNPASACARKQIATFVITVVPSRLVVIVNAQIAIIVINGEAGTVGGGGQLTEAAASSRLLTEHELQLILLLLLLQYLLLTLALPLLLQMRVDARVARVALSRVAY